MTRAKDITTKKSSARPLTRDTEMLICIYTHRGDSPKRIAADLCRPLSQIKDIILQAKLNGHYDYYINRYLSMCKHGQALL